MKIKTGRPRNETRKTEKEMRDYYNEIDVAKAIRDAKRNDNKKAHRDIFLGDDPDVMV